MPNTPPTPTGPPRVLIVGNYPADGQESMLRFARMLADGLREAGWPVETAAPRAVFGGWGGRPAYSGLGKWLAYLDKFVVFPWTLRRRVRALGPGAVVHIADHSNAMYAPAAASAGHRVLVTCHDLGAVRGALGEATDCPASRTGQVLQRWIRRSLGRADTVACVSAATRADVDRLVRRPDGSAPDTRLVPNGLNHPYRPLPAPEADTRLAARVPELADADGFALHVGSGLRRKNREGVLRIFARLRNDWPGGRLVFAGEAPSPELLALAASLGVAERVVAVTGPTNGLLEALYSRAAALVFPSTFEGFGWPVVEAQACGCPVLCSADGGALAEVAGQGAFVRPVADEAAFAGELLRVVRDPAARAAWAAAGQRNAALYTEETMRRRYADLYRELAGRPAAPATAAASASPAAPAAVPATPAVMKTLLLALSTLLPWTLRRRVLIRWLGFDLHPTARIGLSWVFPGRLVMGAHSRIGHLTVCKNLGGIFLGEHVSVGNLCWITGFPPGPSPHFAHQPERRPELHVGAHSAITHRHLIDCTATVTIGAFTTFAGFQSQILTHSIDLAASRQSSAPVSIGAYCFVGTNCVLLGGAALPDRCVLGAKSLLNKAFAEGQTLYGGTPAKAIQTLPEDTAYFHRKAGHVV